MFNHFTFCKKAALVVSLLLNAVMTASLIKFRFFPHTKLERSSLDLAISKSSRAAISQEELKLDDTQPAFSILKGSLPLFRIKPCFDSNKLLSRDGTFTTEAGRVLKFDHSTLEALNHELRAIYETLKSAEVGRAVIKDIGDGESAIEIPPAVEQYRQYRHQISAILRDHLSAEMASNVADLVSAEPPYSTLLRSIRIYEYVWSSGQSYVGCDIFDGNEMMERDSFAAKFNQSQRWNHLFEAVSQGKISPKK